MSAASSYHIPLKFDQTGGLLAVADFIINKAIFANSEWFTQNWFFWMILVYDFHRYSIFMAITSIGIFTLFKNIDKRNISFFNSPDSISRKATFSIAKYSYGIYLNHMVFLNLIFILAVPIFHFKGGVAITFVGTLIISWLLLAILNRIPYIKQIIGAK